MKKEYHYTISRSDRIYLVAFVVLLLAWELVKGVFPKTNIDYDYVPDDKRNTSYPYKNKSYTQKKKYYKDYTPYKKYKPKPFDKTNSSFTPPEIPLDINSATVNELRSMGFSSKVAYNIQKYVANGGAIANQKDLMRIFGMDSIQLEKALPYILFPSLTAKPKSSNYTKEIGEEDVIKIIDLNSATVSDLESLNGIGKVLAERIIKFRESIGGFADIKQLKDCYGISPELFDQLQSRLTTSGEIKIIRINSPDLVNINHPFLPKKLLRIITAYKKQHGPFQSPDELKKVYPVDSNWIDRVLPYISFELIDDGQN